MAGPTEVKKYQVVLTRRAERELHAASNWLAQASQSEELANRWFNRFIQRIETLGSLPTRCGLARENDRFPVELRELLSGHRPTYRAIFHIEMDRVVIISIQHSAQRDLNPDDLDIT